MTGREIYKIWAPFRAKWVDWTRPVPFININNDFKIYNLNEFIYTSINYLKGYEKNTAIIVDLPDEESINEGLSLAKMGYRPIPVYNGTNPNEGVMANVDNHIIEEGLVWGATQLKQIELLQDANPAFLLNTNRMQRYKMDVSVFDNSWDLYHQDLPTSEYFLKNGINKIIIRSKKIESDINKILYKHQKDGIDIYFTNGLEEPKKVKLKRPAKKDMD